MESEKTLKNSGEETIEREGRGVKDNRRRGDTKSYIAYRRVIYSSHFFKFKNSLKKTSSAF